MRVIFRPLPLFPVEFHAPRAASPFKSSHDKSVRLLEAELRHLGAREYVIEAGLREGDIRLDGMPRADRYPRHPGVVVSFESKHGPLRYGTDKFPRWADNLRAVALALESLRRVDRYGIGLRGEQYVGSKQLMSGRGDPSPERGRRLVAEHGSIPAALKATHPDHGGNPDDFADVQAARESG